jgi:thiosulfate reductase cytochrome b subunit
MARVLADVTPASEVRGHARWVRICHWIAAASILTLVFSGFVILMAHPRLYWGDAGNDLTPALIELPISPNYKQARFERPTPFFTSTGSPITANRTSDLFNQNGWARSLHFLAAWWMVFVGVVYLVMGMQRGHFRSHIRPGPAEVRDIARDVSKHVRLRIPPATGGPDYGPLQKAAYSLVIFVASPLMLLTGLTMSPAVTATFPMLLTVFGGHQSARTIHFVVFAALLLFVIAHVAMVIVSGFTRHMRAMTWGD